MGREGEEGGTTGKELRGRRGQVEDETTDDGREVQPSVEEYKEHTRSQAPPPLGHSSTLIL